MTHKFVIVSVWQACLPHARDISFNKGSECDALVWYLDADGDGYGGGDAIADCEPVEGYVDNNLSYYSTFHSPARGHLQQHR